VLADIARDIAALAPDFPQLAEFPTQSLVTERELFYVFHAAPDPTIKAGWRRGYPFPADDGVVISLRLLDDEQRASMQEAVLALCRLGGFWLYIHVFDGKSTRPLAGPIHDILTAHGYTDPIYPS
jgi:hypothetical protein